MGREVELRIMNDELAPAGARETSDGGREGKLHEVQTVTAKRNDEL